ncbi:MAG: hypothetical protein F4Y86_14285 [Gammaproteobacteria bacterium]|nr:hypothetical protein [Gammaproteobacteria bacterium]
MKPRTQASAFGRRARLLAAVAVAGIAVTGYGHPDPNENDGVPHDEYSPVCYIAFDGADLSQGGRDAAPIGTSLGDGAGIVPVVTAPDIMALNSRSVSWAPSSFRLVGTQIMHQDRSVSGRATGGTVKQSDNSKEYMPLERVVDMEYYFYAFPNSVRWATLTGDYGWDHPDSNGQQGFPRAGDPKFDSSVRGRFYHVCLADYIQQTTGGTKEDFIRGWSRPYFSGSEPSSLGAYLTYFYGFRALGRRRQDIVNMVEEGVFYVNESNEAGAVVAPRSVEADADAIVWQCAAPEPSEEDEDTGGTMDTVRSTMVPFNAMSAGGVQGAGGRTICPPVRAEQRRVPLMGLAPGRVYDAFVGAMLVPETVDDLTPRRDGLAGAAHMFAGEVYTMPFDDHDGLFGYLSRANVALPDSTSGAMGTQRRNAVVLERADMPSTNTGEGVPLVRSDVERCRRVDGHLSNQTGSATTTSAGGHGCTDIGGSGAVSQLLLANSNRFRVGIDSSGAGFDHLPYGQTIQGVRFFVPDVPRSPLVQIQSFDGPASLGRWFGDPNPTVPTDEGRAIPRAVVPGADGRVKLRLWPRLNYGMYTVYWWSASVDGGEFSEPVEVPIGEAAREVSDQRVHTILTAAGGYEWEVDAVIGSTYQFQVTATSDVVDALDKRPQVRLLNSVLIGELPEISDIRAVSGLRQATFTWDINTMADLPIIASRYRRHKFDLFGKQCVDGERQMKFCGDVVDDKTLVLPNCDPVPDGAGWVAQDGSTTGVTLDGLERGATYNFGLRVRNHAGESETVWKCVDIGVAPSAPVVTPLLRSADCPNDPEDTARARGCFDFRWEPAVDGGFPVEEYQYFAIPAAEFEEQFPDFPEDPEGGPDDDDSRWVLICGKELLDRGKCPFSASVEDLDLATGYQLLVRARNADGWGRVAFGVVNTLPAAPEAPEDLSAAAGNAALTLTWLAGPDNGAEILAYQYRARPEAATTWSAYVSVEPECTETRAGTECSLAVGGLTNDTEYVFELRAVNSAGFGAEASVTGTPQVAALAAVVTGLREDDSSSSCADFVCNVAFEWTTPQAGCPDRYEYGWVAGRWQSHQCSLQDATCQRADDTVRSCEEVAATGVDAGDSLVFRVRPVVDGRAGSETSITVVAGDPPAEPDNPAATAGVGAITLTWDDPGGPVQRYEYRFRVSGADGAIPGTWSDWLDAGLAERVAIDGLTNGQKYDFEVRAVNAVGTGEVAGSPELYGKAPVAGTAAPGAPGTPQVTVADAEVTLEWPAAELAGDGGNASQYGCRYRASGTIPWEGCASGGVVVDSDTNDATAAVTVTGLVNGLTYEFEIWTIGADDLESDRVTAEGTPLLGSAAPGSPQNLVATPGDGRVTLRWEPAVSTDGVAVAGYEYRWRRVGGAFGAWTDACGFADAERARCRSVVEWSVDALANGTQVQFELRARKGENLTGPVATVWATPRGAPGAPLGLRHAAGDGELSVFWHPPNDGGSPILRYEYRVRVGEAGFGDWQLVDDRLIESGARYTLLLANVRDDIDYVVEVRAVNEAGDGAAASVARLAGTAASEAFSASAGDREVELRWPAATGGDIARYEFRCLPETSGCIGWVDASNRLRRDGNWLVVTVAGLANGTAYTFELRTIDSQGNPGAPDQTTATPSGTPGVPTVQVTPGDGEAILTWQPPAQDGGAPVLHYEYRWSVAGEAFGTWRAHRTGGARIVVGGLANGREHVFAVRAVNPAGPGPEARAAVTPGAAPSAPGQLTATRGDGAVTLRWSAPGADGGVAVSEYQYRYRRADATAFGDWASVGAVTVVTVAGLDNGVEYLFEVRAANAVFVGAGASASATPGAVPGTPRGVAAEPADGQVSLTWSAPESDGGLDIERYEVRHGTQGQVPGAWADVGLDLRTTVQGLTNAVSYVFEVRAVNAVGGGTVASVLASPWVASAPDAPTLTARPDSRRVVLSWNVPNNGGDDIIRFEYRWRVAGEAFGDWIEAALDTSVVVSDLQNGVAHEFEVRAVNGIGVSAASGAEAMPAGLPGTPELTARAGSEEVAISWQPPADDGGLAIELYEYRWRDVAGAFVAWRDAGADRRATARGLRNGTTYEFEVRAVNGIGPGPAATARATPLPGVDDALLAEAWLGRFGRVSASHVVDALQARFTDALDASFAAPWRRPSDRRSDGGRPERETRPREERTVPQSERVRHRGGVGGRWMGQTRDLVFDIARQAALNDWQVHVDTHALARRYFPWLDATSFQLAATPGGGATRVAAWGRLTAGGFEGADSFVEVDGTVRTLTVGGDVERGGLLAGMAVSHSTAEGGFDIRASGNVPARRGDDAASTLTGLYPYARLRAGRVSLWASGGTAQGDMSLAGDGLDVDADLTVGMAAAGLRGVWLGSDVFEVALKSDLLRTWLTAEGDRLAAVEADANRIRLLLEASASSAFEGGRLSSSLELGVRHDSGTTDNAGGLEVGGSLRFAGARRLSLALQGMAVVSHGAEGFGEWGLSGSVLYAPRESGTGPSLRFEPAYGNSASQAERMWAEPDLRHFAFRAEPTFGVDARFGYGLRSPRNGALWQPYIAAGYRRGLWIHRFGWRVEGGWLDVLDGSAFHRQLAPGAQSERGGFGVQIRASRRL